MNDGPIALGKNDSDIRDFKAAGGIRFSIAGEKLAAGFIPRNAAKSAPDGGIFEIAVAICNGSPIDTEVLSRDDGSFSEKIEMAIEKNIAMLMV